jgi:hypothetical protein
VIDIIERLRVSLGKKSAMAKEGERDENEREKGTAPGRIKHAGRGY